MTGDVHVACCTRWPYGLRYVPVSGADVALHDAFDERGRAADELVRLRLAASVVGAWERRALTRMLLVPEHVELVALRRPGR